jgi:hypothetical protein
MYSFIHFLLLPLRAAKIDLHYSLWPDFQSALWQSTLQ